VKDQVSTADVVTTYGSEAFAEFVPAKDATIFTRLQQQWPRIWVPSASARTLAAPSAF
jgi:hypothetical protein